MTRPYHGVDEVDRLLEPYRDAVDHGISDKDLSKKTGLSIRTVQRWRLREGLKKKGPTSKRAAQLYAISAFGEALQDVKQRVQQSAVDGRWEPPLFVTRAHLDYTQFLRVLDAGSRVLGMSSSELVAALGMSHASVEQGLAIYASRTSMAARCACCEGPVFTGAPAPFCSLVCQRIKTKVRE